MSGLDDEDIDKDMLVVTAKGFGKIVESDQCHIQIPPIMTYEFIDVDDGDEVVAIETDIGPYDYVRIASNKGRIEKISARTIREEQSNYDKIKLVRFDEEEDERIVDISVEENSG